MPSRYNDAPGAYTQQAPGISGICASFLANSVGSSPARLIAGVVGALLILTVTTAAHAQIQYSRSAENVVIRFQEVLGEFADGDRGPSIEIYGDGTARVHYPVFMKRAGDYTTQLDAADMDRLIAIVAGGGLLNFDATAVTHAKARAANARAATAARTDQRPTRHIVLDASTTIVELDLGGVHRTIRWSGLRSDARHYPGVSEIQGLAQTQRELLTFMERDDLTRVTP